MQNKTLVLASGGADCIVAAAHLKREGHEVTLLHFQYGQKGEEKEQKALNACARYMNMPAVTKRINCFEGMRTQLLKGTPGEGKDLIGDVEYVPARNLILLAIAAGIAESNNFAYIATGNHKSTRAYPDNTPEFTKRFDALLEYSLFKGVICRCIAPVNHLTKGEVMHLGLEIDAPLHLTWSCYVSNPRPCGKCIACQSRAEAFASIKQPDPALLESL